MEKKKQAQEILKKYNQTHIKLDNERIINQVLSIDFEKLNKLYIQAHNPILINSKDISPITPIRKKDLSEKELLDYTVCGENAIKNGEYAVIIMSGGQGSRLGHNGPKGTFKINLNGEEKYLFEIVIDDLKLAYSKYSTYIHFYLMTSSDNHNEIIEFFENNNYFGYPKKYTHFFMQEDVPLLTQTNKLPIGENGLIKFASNGNGNIYKALQLNGMISQMEKEGIKWIFAGSIDNILSKIVDPLFVGLTIKNKTPIASKSVVKTNPTEKVGVFAKIKNKPGIIEYIELTEEMANERHSNNDLKYGDLNIVNHLFSIDALEKLVNVELPYHIARKNNVCLDENGKFTPQKIFKFETFIFDAFIFFDNMTLFRVSREEEFAPIKNAKGADSPETAKKLYENYTNGK